MTDHIESEVLDQRVLDVIQILNDRLVVRGAKAGWHNAFKGDRIGTSGSALPLRFLLAAGEPVPHLEEVLGALRSTTFEEDEQAAWSILSLGPGPNVEGTVWPLLALIDNGDPADGQLITRAESWLVAQQHADGGWGSDLSNEPRLTLTASAIYVLSKRMPRRAPVLTRAGNWLRDTQRAENGSWGATAAESGTIHHTALACLALIQLGANRSDPALQRGSAYLRANWQPLPRSIQTETYDVHQPAGDYKRCVLQHDSDALASEAFLSLRGPGDLARAIRAASKIFEVGVEDLEVDQPTLWTILPRGFLALRLRSYVPVGGQLVARNSVAVAAGGEGEGFSRDLALVTLSELPFKPRNPVRLIYWLIGLVLLLLTVLTALGDYGVGEYTASVVLAGLFALATIVRDRRS
jgi:Squalene-hopene cyclase N-terminal domain